MAQPFESGFGDQGFEPKKPVVLFPDYGRGVPKNTPKALLGARLR